LNCEPTSGLRSKTVNFFRTIQVAANVAGISADPNIEGCDKFLKELEKIVNKGVIGAKYIQF
jgi:hypothetical protein